MKSRLLVTLDAEIAAATQPVEADTLRAQRACFLARQGQLTEARAVLASLQSQYAGRPHALVNGWLSLVEGLISYFTDLTPNAYDKLRRAHALSGAARDMKLHALAAAWLAHMKYVTGDRVATGRHLSEAFQFAEADHHGAQSRACLVAAVAYHFGERFEIAQPWYDKARQHASAEGDDVMVSAIIYNMAALQANQARQMMFRGEDASAIARGAMLSVESSSNFDALFGIISLDALIPVLRANVLSLQGRYADALPFYESHLAKGVAQGLGPSSAWLLADRAWCRAHTGQHEAALEDAKAAAEAVLDGQDTGDRAAAHSRLAQVFAMLEQADAAAHHQAQAPIHWQAHQSDQAQTVAVLDKTLANLRS